MLTVREAAQALGLKEPTIRLWIAKRRIEHVKLGRSVRISTSEIDRILKENTVPLAREGCRGR
jgi:excisionase family DNA binding protein